MYRNSSCEAKKLVTLACSIPKRFSEGTKWFCNDLFPSGNRFGIEKAGVTAFFVSHELFLYISNLILTVFDFAWV